MAQSARTVRIAFVPSMRFPHSQAWCSAMRARCLDAFKGVAGLEVVVPDESVTPFGLVQNDNQAAAAIKFFQGQNVDGVMVGAMDFADEISSATVAAALDKPTLLFGTKEGDALPNGGRVSDSFCGTLSIATALHRRNIPFIFAGLWFPEEEGFLAEIGTFVSAVAAAKAFVGARIGQVGVRPERFETVAYDERLMLTKFNQRVIPLELSQVVDAAKAIPADDAAIRRTMDEIASEATVVNVNENFLNKAARFELALQRFYEARELSALAVQCWPTLGSLYGIAACSTFGRLTSKGMMTACEVDVLGTLDMIVQNAVTLGEIPHFIDWTIQHRSRPNTFLSWHCGNGPTCLRAPNSPVTLRNRRRPLDVAIPADDTGAGIWEFALKTGPVTFSRVVEYNGEFKMLVTKGEVIEDPARESGSASWVQVPDLQKLYATMVEEGFIHHASMIYGDQTKALATFCKLTGIKVVAV